MSTQVSNLHILHVFDNVFLILCSGKPRQFIGQGMLAFTCNEFCVLSNPTMGCENSIVGFDEEALTVPVAECGRTCHDYRALSDVK
jgi:hypothetical protein